MVAHALPVEIIIEDASVKRLVQFIKMEKKRKIIKIRELLALVKISDIVSAGLPERMRRQNLFFMAELGS